MKRASVMALMVVGAGLGGAVPASAAYSNCPDMGVCFWNDLNYNGNLSWRQSGYPLMNISGSNNDKLSSWANRSYTRASAYEHANGGGACMNMKPRTSNSWVGSYWNDRVSSWWTKGGCGEL